MAPSLTKEQNSVIKELYKCGRKIAHYQSHVYFLNESLKLNFIPKRFHIKNNLPGNKSETQKQLDIASFISIKCEKCDYEIKLQNTIGEFEHLKHRLNNLFTPSAVIVETKRLEKHLKKVENAKKKVVLKKIKRDFDPSFNVNDVVADNLDASDVTLADDDEALEAHRNCSLSMGEVTLVQYDEEARAHNTSASNFVANVTSSVSQSDVTLAADDEIQVLLIEGMFV